MPLRRKKTITPLMSTALRRKVSSALAASPVFRRLPAARRQKLVREAAGIAAFTELVRTVDFPAFVSGLIAGVFDAVLDATAQQTEAYVALLASVTRSVNRFTEANEGDPHAHLAESYPGLFVICADGSIAVAGQCPEASQGRSRSARDASRRRARRKAPTSAS